MRGGRALPVVAGAAGFGLLAALVAGLGGDRLTTASQVRGAIGNLSAPWVLVAFVAGWAVTRRRAGGAAAYGALVGLAATLVALAMFYLVATLTEDLGGHGLLGDLRLELTGNRVYWEDGLVSAPIFGAAGAWWRSRPHARSPWLVVGTLLVGEPLVLLAVGAIEPGGVLGGGSGLPLVLRIVPGFGLNAQTPSTSIAVYAAEAALGIAVLATAARRRVRA